MRLRTQVLLVGLCTLAVPALGWQLVHQLHLSLQQTRIDAQTLAIANMRVALAGSDALAARLASGATPADPRDWYAESAPWPLFVDGYADDWQELGGAVSRFAADAFSPGESADPRSSADAVDTAGTADEPRAVGADGDEPNGEGTAATLALRVARRSGKLFLFASVDDARVVHHLPPPPIVDPGENERPDPESLRVNGDAVEVYVETPEGTRTHALLSVIAPGPVTVVRAVDDVPSLRYGPDSGARLERWQAEWVDRSDGYQVEIELPLPPLGSRVGIAAIDVDRPGDTRDAWVGSMSPQAMREAAGGEGGGRLYHESPAVRALLLPWVPAGSRARLFDAEGRLLADVEALYTPLPEGDEPPADPATGLLDAILFRVFSWFAAGDLPLLPETEKTRQPLHLDGARRASVGGVPPTTRYVTVDNDRVLGTLVALGEGAAGRPRGYLLFESNEEHASWFAGSRLARLFALLLLASLAIGALLLGWATLLSLRVRRLARDAGRAVDDEGRIATLAGSDAGDEIGDLSRDLSALLARSAAYTHHLETLSGRLSHELGTPLSIVRTSLESLDRSQLDVQTRTLVERADGGAERLAGILRGLVESTRLERSVQHATFVALELRTWLREAAEQYAQVYPEHRFTVSGPPRSVHVRASAALLQQALDKLVANACDFATAPDITLVFGLADGGEGACVTLAVANRGPAIGAARRDTLFEPSYTTRAGEDEGGVAHGGLGLYIVRMIAEAHGGEPFARDRDGGVVIGLRWPGPSPGGSVRSIRDIS